MRPQNSLVLLLQGSTHTERECCRLRCTRVAAPGPTLTGSWTYLIFATRVAATDNTGDNAGKNAWCEWMASGNAHARCEYSLKSKTD